MMGVLFSNVNGEFKIYPVNNPNKPSFYVDKAGNIKSKKKVTIVTAANVTATVNDDAFVFYGLSANKTVTLPTAVGNKGCSFQFGKEGSGSAGIVAAASGQTIAGLSSVSISGTHKGFTCVSDNARWLMLNCSDNLTTDGVVSV